MAGPPGCSAAATAAVLTLAATTTIPYRLLARLTAGHLHIVDGVATNHPATTAPRTSATYFLSRLTLRAAGVKVVATPDLDVLNDKAVIRWLVTAWAAPGPRWSTPTTRPQRSSDDSDHTADSIETSWRR